jgi:disulfide bond formation protein DsbB
MIKLSTLHPSTVSALLGAIAAASLGFALIGQYGFSMHPCELCIWQRWPFGIIIVLGIIGFAFSRTAQPIVGLIGLTYLSNAALAMFHSGVERKWWEGLKGCATPDLSGSLEDLMKRIQAAPVTRCDDIGPSLFGLSMANYNVALCLGLAIICGLYLILRNQRPA